MPTSTVKTTLKKLSICPCGFPVLHDHIPLGAEYAVTPSLQSSGTLICGGCHKTIAIPMIWAMKRGDSCAGWLPKEIFEPLE